MFALAVLVTAATLYAASPVRGFNIKTSAAVVNRPGADISDVYLFPSPTNSNNIVAVMNVQPGLPAGSGTTAFFDTNVLYAMKFDTRYSSEAIGNRPSENIIVQFSFGAVTNGAQQVFVYGPGTPNETGTNTTLLSSGFATGTGLVNKTFVSGGLTVFAGVREDPFFFDLTQFFKIVPDRNAGSTATSCLPGVGSATCPTGFNSVGTDFFNNANVLSIVIEMPRSTLQFSGSTPVIAYWATTSTQSGQ
ncbi:MAG: DUF4331 family protein [Candidatus Eremiobacteraeota bacterium]|nr:DUF4331 family protein [Candidatus Eremiobacteraeota bacterium]